MIEAGAVRVAGRAAAKPAESVADDAELAVAALPETRYVSRAALKLAHALDHFRIAPEGKVALDLGASTGGFTQVLLERGAARVYAVDVGHGQLAAPLLDDERVVSLEGTHAKDLGPVLVPEAQQFLVCDVSFISLTKALPPALGLAAPGAELLALIKPQFEVGREHIGKGGIVRDRLAQEGACSRIADWLEREQGWQVLGLTESPIKGGDGNREFLIAARAP